MDTKKCNNCQEEKSFDLFSKNKRSKDGLQNKCKECNKKYRHKHKNRTTKYLKDYYVNNKDKIIQQKKEYVDTNKEKISEYQKEYREENKEKISEYQKEYRVENKEKIQEYETFRYERDKEKRNAYSKTYYNENKIRILKMVSGNRSNRYKNDTVFRLTESLRSRMRMAINEGNGFKRGSSQELLGCDWQTVREHLENQFTDGMTWDNYGYRGWHVDHIRPCSSFDLTDSEQQKLCFHYTNLQPLWAKDNFRKSDKWEDTGINTFKQEEEMF